MLRITGNQRAGIKLSLELPLVCRALQRQSLRASIRRALESGVGLYHRTWRLHDGVAGQPGDHLTAEVIAWSREVLSQMHRPYGLDYVTLALAVLGDEDHEVASTNFGVLRPEDFYHQGPAETQVAATLRDWTHGQVMPLNPRVRLSAVLFSWGDLTKELLLAG